MIGHAELASAGVLFDQIDRAMQLESAVEHDGFGAAGGIAPHRQGATLQPFSTEVMDGCYKAAQELYAELNQKNPAFKKIYDSYTAFMADGYLWTQVADYTMDSYMIRYRTQKT